MAGFRPSLAPMVTLALVCLGSDQIDILTAYVWMLSQHRAALAQQLLEVEEYARQAVRVSCQHGVKQSDVATLTGRCPGRVSQIINEVHDTRVQRDLDRQLQACPRH